MTFRVGEIPAGYFMGGHNQESARLRLVGEKTMAELLDLALWRRVPSNIETAAFQPTQVDTWEDYDIVTALNAVLSTAIREGEAVELMGTLEVIDAGGGGDDAMKYASGEVPDDDKTVRTEIPTDAATTYVRVILITDKIGQIKIEVDSLVELTAVFHLEAYRYVGFAAAA